MTPEQKKLIQKVAGSAEKPSLQKFAAVRAPRDFGAEMIQQFIKGAKENGFGRPVTIQIGELSPEKVAHLSGAVRALSEADYSVKEAADALGVSPETILSVIEATR